MYKDEFSNLYAELRMPVIICENNKDLSVKYMNVHASVMFYPSHSVDQMSGSGTYGVLFDYIYFETNEERATFFRMILELGFIDHYQGKILTFDDKIIPVMISGNRISYHGLNDYFVLMLDRREDYYNSSNESRYEIASIVNASFLADNVDESIQTVIAIAGKQTQVSRVYIFEEISSTMTRNTYEWCADGVEPAIQDLQNLEKADYNYDVIVNSGLYIVENVHILPQKDREILEMQGIKAVAIVPIYDYGTPLGYVGFDDCERPRAWSHDEIQFLESVSVLLATFMKRRNAERQTRHTQNVLQLITDNSDNIIYVNSLDDYKLLFVSKALAESLNKKPEELLGVECWKVLQVGKTGPCSFCPIPKIKMSEDVERSEVFVWEFENENTKKTYLAKDNIIRWVDGQMVHVETATDISQRTEYEEKLRYYASTDVMTGVYNREWGSQELERRLKDKSAEGSLCFIDLDGLKKTNDNYGHAAGDELLIETIKIICEFLPEDGFICRWGGDEFLIWVDYSVVEADDFIKKIQKKMEIFNKTEKRLYKLSFSYGIVPFLDDGVSTLDTLVTMADNLMYDNKMEKRNRNKRRRRTD